MSRGAALQRRHLAERPYRGREPHHDAPADQADPGAGGEIVGEELGRKAIAGVGRPGAHGDEEAGRPPCAGERVRDERDDPQDGDRGDNARAARVIGVARRGRPRQHADADRHRRHAQDLAPPDPFSQHTGADPEQHDQAHRKGGLHQRERDEQQGADLRRPAAQREPGSDQPARPPDQAPEEGDAEVLLLRSLPRLERLQADGSRVQDRGREGEREAGDDEHEQAGR